MRYDFYLGQPPIVTLIISSVLNLPVHVQVVIYNAILDQPIFRGQWRWKLNLSVRTRSEDPLCFWLHIKLDRCFVTNLVLSDAWSWKNPLFVEYLFVAKYLLEACLGSKSYWIRAPWPAITNRESTALRWSLEGVSCVKPGGSRSQDRALAKTAVTRSGFEWVSSVPCDCSRWRVLEAPLFPCCNIWPVARAVSDEEADPKVDGWRSCANGRTTVGWGNGGNRGFAQAVEFAACSDIKIGLQDLASTFSPAERWKRDSLLTTWGASRKE